MALKVWYTAEDLELGRVLDWPSHEGKGPPLFAYYSVEAQEKYDHRSTDVSNYYTRELPPVVMDGDRKAVLLNSSIYSNMLSFWWDFRRSYAEDEWWDINEQDAFELKGGFTIQIEGRVDPNSVGRWPFDLEISAHGSALGISDANWNEWRGDIWATYQADTAKWEFWADTYSFGYGSSSGSIPPFAYRDLWIEGKPDPGKFNINEPFTLTWTLNPNVQIISLNKEIQPIVYNQPIPSEFHFETVEPCCTPESNFEEYSLANYYNSDFKGLGKMVYIELSCGGFYLYSMKIWDGQIADGDWDKPGGMKVKM